MTTRLAIVALFAASTALGQTPSSASGPSGPEPSSQAQPAAEAGAPKRIRVDEQTMQARAIYKPTPEYSVEARLAGIEGVVKLQAIIGTDGRIKDLTAVSTEEVLAEAAYKTVSQWRYRPTIINGATVEVETEIHVNFQLSGTNLVDPLGMNIPRATYRPDPPYTDQARKAGREGTVTLSIGIDEQGNVTDVKEISKKLGDGLDKSAIQAVKAWKFQPATFEGKLRPLHMAFDVKFRLPDAGTGQVPEAPQ